MCSKKQYAIGFSLNAKKNKEKICINQANNCKNIKNNERTISSIQMCGLGEIHHTLGHFKAATNDADEGEIQDLKLAQKKKKNSHQPDPKIK